MYPVFFSLAHSFFSFTRRITGHSCAWEWETKRHAAVRLPATIYKFYDIYLNIIYIYNIIYQLYPIYRRPYTTHADKQLDNITHTFILMIHPYLRHISSATAADKRISHCCTSLGRDKLVSKRVNAQCKIYTRNTCRKSRASVLVNICSSYPQTNVRMDFALNGRLSGRGQRERDSTRKYVFDIIERIINIVICHIIWKTIVRKTFVQDWIEKVKYYKTLNTCFGPPK